MTRLLAVVFGLTIVAAMLLPITRPRASAWEYMDYHSQTLGWAFIVWEKGFDFGSYGTAGRARSSGSLYFDAIFASATYYTSCNNGATWNYQRYKGDISYNSTVRSVTTGYATEPTCSSSPKYRTVSNHEWPDSGKSYVVTGAVIQT